MSQAIVALVVALSQFAWPAVTSAATVEVSETHGEPNVSTLTFAAVASESNDLSLSLVSKTSEILDLMILDKGAAVIPGSGCSGGRSPGIAVYCHIHEPKLPNFEYCGKSCSRPIPGTWWRGAMRIGLGEGDNSFDGTSFSGDTSFEMFVSSGSGDDYIATGSGEDVIDPGAGSDQIRSGAGFDQIIATPSPDGPDRYENAPNNLDSLSYAQRSTPVRLSGSTAGASGEDDTLIGGFEVVGGSAGDYLEGGLNDWIIEGGPGDDVLVGTRETTVLYGGLGADSLQATGAGPNRLIGESGDDTYLGGPGTDIIRESEKHSSVGSSGDSIPSSSGGDDVARGGGGNDVFEMQAGVDHAFGGAGNDRFSGGMEEDLLVGGLGADRMIGGSGFDRLLGGPGSDTIFSGRWHWDPTKSDFPFPATSDDRRDKVDCGRGSDVAVRNPWDITRNCETMHTLKPVGK